jgi:hypothetical protein
MKPTKILLAVSLLLSLVACSNQSRTAAEMATQEDLFGQNGVFTQMQASNNLLQTLSVNSFVNEKSSFLYHARETAGRPAASILSVGDMSALDNRIYKLPDMPSSQIGMSQVDVIFVDNVNQNGQRSFALGFRIGDGYTQAINVFSGVSQYDDYSFSNNQFETAIRMESGSTIVVRSTDVSADYKNELSDAIKLNLYKLGQDNSLRYIGQISTMLGYGNK